MLKKIITVCLIATIWLLLGLTLHQASFMRSIELKFSDMNFRFRGPRPPSSDILLIGIDEKTFHHLNMKYPFPPLVYGDVIRKLNDSGALVIAVDLLYSEPTRECDPPNQDELLGRIIADAGNVVWGSELEDGTRYVPPISVIADHLSGSGFLNFPDELDNHIRRFKVRSAGASSFAAVILEAYAGFLPDHWNSDELFYIDFCGPAGSFPVISMADILTGQFTPDSIDNKLIIVGPTFMASHDLFPTPFHDPSRPDMAGVEIHAQILNTLISGKTFRSDGALPALAIFSLLILAACFVLILGSFWGSAVLACLVIAGWFGFSIYQFHHHVLIPSVLPIVVAGLAYISTGIYSYLAERQERKKIRNLFSSYIDPTVVNYLLKNPAAVTTEGSFMRATIIYTDIQGFSTIAAHMPPDRLVAQLNDYFEELTDIVIKHGGMYDKYVGDALMAIFGFPIPSDDQCRNAVKAALEMQRILHEMNSDWEAQHRPEFKTRIGIATGDVIIGSVGGTHRKGFTAYGNVVNKAARLEALNKETNTWILIDEETASMVSDVIQLRNLGTFQLKGIREETTVYEPLP